MALELLKNNEVNRGMFNNEIRQLLKKGDFKLCENPIRKILSKTYLKNWLTDPVPISSCGH